MFSEGKKAIIMTDDSTITRKLELYFRQRYNLQLETTNNLMDLMNRANNLDEPYEIAIIDENVTGLATTSHVFRSIKGLNYIPNVLYLSTLHEISNPTYKNRLEIPPDYFNEPFREEQTLLRRDNIRSMFLSVTESASIRDVCQKTAQTIAETLNADCAVCVLPRYDILPEERGIVAGYFPDTHIGIYDIPMRGHQYFDELIDYFKPIHIPDLFLEKDFCQVSMDKFASIFRSALVLPMVIGTKFLGYIGLFMHREPRVYNLTEIDQCSRLADFAAATSVNLFVSTILKIRPVPVEMEENL